MVNLPKFQRPNRFCTDDNGGASSYIAAMTDTFLALPGRAVLSLTGPDTLTLLERLVTHNTMNWETGEARYGALLTPQGKVIADYIAQRTQDGVLMDVAKSAVDALAKRLKMFRLRSAVEITVDDTLVVAAVPEDHSGSFDDPRDTRLPRRAFIAREAASGRAEIEAERIALGIAEQGVDFGDADVFPSDINMDLHHGVDLKKGCFVGQEVVSRMHRRGNIRRRTVTLHGKGLSAGTALMGETALGDVTSAGAEHALARVRVDRLAKALTDGTALHADDKPVSVEKTDWLQVEMAAFLNHE